MKNAKFILSMLTAFVLTFAVTLTAGAPIAVGCAAGFAVSALSVLGAMPTNALCMSMGMTNNEAVISRILPKLWDKGYVPQGSKPKVTQGYICSLFNLQGSFNTINFNILVNQGTVRATENRLNIVDMFTVTHWGLFLMKAGASTTATDAEISVAQPQTFENPGIFTAANEAANLGSIYRGNIQVKVDNDVIVDSYDTARFRRVGEAQQALKVSTEPTLNSYFRSEQQGPNYGFSEVDPEITFNGVGKNEVVLNLPANLSMAGTTSTNFLVLVCRGLLWQNSSKLNRS